MCRHGGSGEGYDSGDDTWEPLVNLGNAEAAITAYERAAKRAKTGAGAELAWSLTEKLPKLVGLQVIANRVIAKKTRHRQAQTTAYSRKMRHYRKKETKKGNLHLHHRVSPGFVGIRVGVGVRCVCDEDKEDEQEEEEADEELMIRAAAAKRDVLRAAASQRRIRQREKRNRKKKCVA